MRIRIHFGDLLIIQIGSYSGTSVTRNFLNEPLEILISVVLNDIDVLINQFMS